MRPNQFSNLLLLREYDKVQNALDKGYDANTPVNKYGMTPLESCSHSDDYRMMYLLWNAGAKPTTPLTKEVLKKFEKGKSWESFVDKKKKKKRYDTATLVDLTHSFTVAKLQWEEGKIKCKKNDYSIAIPAAPFVLDGEAVFTSVSLNGVTIEGELKGLVGKSITFPVNPTPGYIDGSILIRGSHVPVDVTRIHLRKVTKHKIQAELTASFLFGLEATGFKDETITLDVTLKHVDA